MLDDREKWIWFAGLFEGEGCIYFQNKNSVCLALASTDEDVVKKCADIAGGPIYSRQPKISHHKVQYTWRVGTAARVLEILDRIEPFLGKRRSEKAKEARKRLSKVPAAKEFSLECLIAGRRSVPKKKSKICPNCRCRPIKAKDRCNPCYEYRRRHGIDRPSGGIRPTRKKVTSK